MKTVSSESKQASVLPFCRQPTYAGLQRFSSLTCLHKRIIIKKNRIFRDAPGEKRRIIIMKKVLCSFLSLSMLLLIIPAGEEIVLE